MIHHCAILAFLVGLACSVPGNANAEDSGSFFGKGLHYAINKFRECANDDLSTCLKLKLVAALDRVDRALPDIPLSDGVEFVKKPEALSNEIPKSEAEIEASLPRSLGAKDVVLNSLIADKIRNFFSSHTLQVKLPSSSDVKRSFEESPRKKGSKGSYSNMVLVPMLLGGTLIPLALKGLVLLAGKALLVSTIALVLGGVVGLKSLLSPSSEPRSPQRNGPIAIEVANGVPYQRSLDNTEENAQNLAYNGYVPNYL